MIIKIIDIPLTRGNMLFGALKFYFKANDPNKNNISLLKEKLFKLNENSLYNYLAQNKLLPLDTYKNFESTIFLYEVGTVISGAFKIEFFKLNKKNNIYILESIFESSKRRI